MMSTNFYIFPIELFSLFEAKLCTNSQNMSHMLYGRGQRWVLVLCESGSHYVIVTNFSWLSRKTVVETAQRQPQVAEARDEYCTWSSVRRWARETRTLRHEPSTDGGCLQQRGRRGPSDNINTQWSTQTHVVQRTIRIYIYITLHSLCAHQSLNSGHGSLVSGTRC